MYSYYNDIRFLRRAAVTAPCVFPLLTCVGVALGIFHGGTLLRRSYAPIILALVLSLCLVMSLHRVFQFEAADSGSDGLETTHRKRIIRYYQAMWFLLSMIGAGFSLTLLGGSPPKYAMGIVCGVLGIYTNMAGYLKDQEARKLLSISFGKECSSTTRSEHGASFEIYGRKYQLLVLAAYIASAVGIIVLFCISGRNSPFSVWDLGGVMFLIASSVGWDYRVGRQFENKTDEGADGVVG